MFTFTLLYGAPKGFMNALKALIKPFEVLQRSAKTKIYLILISIRLAEMHGTGRDNISVLLKWHSILQNPGAINTN